MATEKEKKAKAKAAAKEKAKTEAKAKEEAEAKVKAEAKAEEKARLEAEQAERDLQDKSDDVEGEAKTLGVKQSKTTLSSFKDKNPDKLEKERVRQEKLKANRTEKRIAKAKALAKLKPIDKRRNLLRSRFRAVTSRARPNTYSNANLEAWIEELNMIDDNPKQWNRITKNGTVNFTPGNKKKQTARDKLDAMNLDDDKDEAEE